MARWGGPIFRRSKDYRWRRRRRGRIVAVTAASLALSATGTATTAGSAAAAGNTTLSATGAATSGGSVNVGRVWVAALSATGAAASGGSANVIISGQVPVPTGVNANNQLVDQFDVPGRWPVFSSWAMAMRLSNSDITTYLGALKAKGFRGVNFAFCGGVATNTDLNAVQYKNVAGSNFFTGTPFTSATLGAAFATTDWIVQECERLDMVAMLALFCSFGDSGIIEQVVAASNAQMEAFGAAVGARYDTYPNVVWEIMGDNIWAASDTLGRRLDYFAKGLDTGRTSYPNLWFCEPFPGTDAMEHFLDDEGTDPTGYQWLHMDANALYSYDNDGVVDAEAVRAAAVAFTTRDICWWDSEGPYAHSNAYDDGYGEHQGIRMRNASDFIEDCAIVNYGDEKWWGFDLPNASLGDWHDVPTDTTTVEASYVWAIVDQYIDGDATYTPTSWIATGEGTGDAKAASGHSDTAGVCMFPDSRTITVNTTFMPGTTAVRLRWYDPSAGTYSTIAASEAQNASRSVTHPGTNSASGTDWLLIVDLVDLTLSASGLAQSGGSAAFTATTTASATGATTTGGSAAFVINKFLTATGATTTGGSAALGGNTTLAATGATTTDGNAAAVIGKPLSATGAASTAGSVDATITSGATSFSLAATGIAQTGGSAAILQPGLSAAGASTTGGSAAVALSASATASGAASTAGSAALAQSWTLSATGTTATAGSAAATITSGSTSFAIAATGIAQTGGSAILRGGDTLSAAGQAQTSGSVSFVGTYPLAASGIAQTGGHAAFGINGITVPPEAFDVADIYGRDQPTIVGTDAV